LNERRAISLGVVRVIPPSWRHVDRWTLETRVTDNDIPLKRYAVKKTDKEIVWTEPTVRGSFYAPASFQGAHNNQWNKRALIISRVD